MQQQKSKSKSRPKVTITKGGYSNAELFKSHGYIYVGPHIFTKKEAEEFARRPMRTVADMEEAGKRWQKKWAKKPKVQVRRDDDDRD